MALALDLNIVAGSVWQDSAGTIPAAAGDPVGRVDDANGGGFHVTQDVTGSKPTLLQDANGHLYLDLDGADDYLNNTTFQPTSGGTQPFSVVLVEQMDNLSGSRGLFEHGSSTGQLFWETTRWNLNFGAQLRGSTTNTSRHIIQADLHGASSALYEDNVQLLSGNAGTNAWATGLNVGKVASVYHLGRIYRLRIFDAALDSTERTAEYTLLDDLYSNPAGGGDPEPINLSLGYVATGTTGYSLSVVAQPASRTLGHAASVTTGYDLSLSEGTQAGAVTLSYAASVTAGYGLSPQAQAGTRTLGYSASATAGYALSVVAGTPGVDTVTLDYVASATTGYGLSLQAGASTRTLGHGASETVGYSLAIGAGGQIVTLSHAASTTAGYEIDVTAQLALVALDYVDSVTVGYALRVQDGLAEIPEVITLSLESTHTLMLSLESSHVLTLSLEN